METDKETNLKNYLGQLYQHYCIERPNEDWVSAFDAFCDKIKQTAKYLEGKTKKDLQTAFEKAGGEDFDSFISQCWYERANGVASVGLGGVSKENYKKLMQEDEFWEVVCKAIKLAKEDSKNSVIKQVWNDAHDWMESYAETNHINRFPAVVNRFIAGCIPGKCTTIVPQAHYNTFISQINWSGIDKLNKDWLESNLYILELLDSQIKHHNLHIENDNIYYRSTFFWWLYDTLGLAQDDKQIVFHGSPGTGKTWKAKEISKSKIISWHNNNKTFKPKLDTNDKLFAEFSSLIQFHPSFGYEDFVEGIRPTSSQNGNIKLGLVEGVFKKFCKKAATWEIDYYNATRQPLEEKTTVSDIKDNIKDKKITSEIWRFITENDDIKNDEKLINLLPPYFFIIDEINRAELSRVFGELMYSLEYRGASHKIETQYSAMHDGGNFDKSSFLIIDDKEYFFIPYNLYLYGTMNTIDRSVESFDFALRRRFRWIEVKPDLFAARQIMTENHIPEDFITKFCESLKRLNERISEEPLLGPHYMIGHAYMKAVGEYSGPGGIKSYINSFWTCRLEPLLTEYFRGIGNSGVIGRKLEALKNEFIKV